MERVREALRVLSVKYPRPDLKLEISEPFDTNMQWGSASWPNNGLPGLYIFADENDRVVYIGKGSVTISARLNGYWRKGPNDETLSKSDISKGVRYVYTIGIPIERAFEASSIEEFLISRVNPVRNTNCKRPMAESSVD
ncbi:MAG: GIY-YIG nuclease family protein [Pseudomonadota bacterium]|nr:GIY-YIG nuclease family protein [Pseudomonadota bacterium]